MKILTHRTLYLELLGNSDYRQSFEEEGEKADSKYDQLAPNFTKQHLTWIPVGYTLQVRTFLCSSSFESRMLRLRITEMGFKELMVNC